jgi:hypothetical protein
MKVNVKTAISATTLIVVTLTYALFYFHNSKLNEGIQKTSMVLENLRFKQAIISEGFFHFYDFADVSVSLDFEVTTNKGEVKPIRDCFGKKAIFLFVKNNGCTPCHFNHLELLKKVNLEKEIQVVACFFDFDRVYVRELAASTGTSGFVYTSNGYNYGFDDTGSSMVLFTFDKAQEKAYCYFSPSEYLPELSEKYFQTIVKRF